MRRQFEWIPMAAFVAGIIAVLVMIISAASRPHAQVVSNTKAAIAQERPSSTINTPRG